MNTEGVDRLRFAIVEQACKDYSSTCIPYTKKRMKAMKNMRNEKLKEKGFCLIVQTFFVLHGFVSCANLTVKVLCGS